MNPNDAQQPSSPVNQAQATATPSTHTFPGSNKKSFGKIIVIAAIVVVALGGGAAAYLGFIAPNQPDRIWKTALSNTAKGYDKLVEQSDEQSDATGGKVKGDFKVDSPQAVLDGTFKGAYDQKNSNFTFNVGAAGTRVNFAVLTTIPDSATTPDMYIKADGLASVGNLLASEDPALAEYFASLDNKFYFVDHTLFDQYAQAATSDTSDLSDLTADDAKAISEALGRVNREYLFTTNQDKAVLKVAAEVGKETREDRDVYHFKVGYDKNHLKSYAAELKTAMQQTKLKTIIPDSTYDELLKEVESLDGKGQADVWVDLKTKLIRTVRFTDNKTKSTFDIGVPYNGGDEYPLSFTVKDDNDTATVKISLNGKTNIVTLRADGSLEESDHTVTFAAKLTFEASNDAVEFTKPQGAEPLMDLIAPFLNSAGLDAGSIDPAGGIEPTTLQ